MKKNKKIIAGCMAGIMAISMSTALAFAAPAIDVEKKGSITVYKYSTEGVQIEAGDGLENTDINGIPIEGVEYTIIRTHELDESGNIVKLTENEDTIATELTNENGIAVFEDLELGRYELQETKGVKGYQRDYVVYEIDVPLFDTQTGALQSVDGKVVYDIKVYPKNRPYQAKILQKHTAEDDEYYSLYPAGAGQQIQVGDSVKYQLQADVPMNILEEHVVFTYFEMSNELDAALILDEESVMLYLTKNGNQIVLEKDTDYVIDTETSQLLKVKLTQSAVLGALNPQEDKIFVEFEAKLSNLAIDGNEIKNKIEVDFQAEDEADNVSTETQSTAIAPVTGEIALINVESTALKTAIQGAKFQLLKESESGEAKSIEVNGKQVSVIEMEKKTTDENGEIVWDKLPSGTYYIRQEESAEAYNEIVEIVYVANLHSILSEQEENTLFAEITIESVLKGRLPQTGGLGTFGIIFAGIVLMGSSIWVAKKKKENEKES